MKTDYNANHDIVITLESSDEADVMHYALNWALHSLSKSNIVDTNRNPNSEQTERLFIVQNHMWESWWKVHSFSNVKPENKEKTNDKRS